MQRLKIIKRDSSQPVPNDQRRHAAALIKSFPRSEPIASREMTIQLGGTHFKITIDKMTAKA